MMSISPPKSATQAVNYCAEEFAAARGQYYTEGATIPGQWHGALAASFGLTGDVDEEQFASLAQGQHPITGAQLVKHQTPRKTAKGETTMEHRAGWDATFSAPKSISLTALVGGDAAVREAHRLAVDKAIALALEPHAQARLGGNQPAETTQNLVIARFEHDSARPVKGYAAPQVHTHVFVFNMTETASGRVKPLQPREIYRSKAYATAVYRSELAWQLQARGYQIGRGETDQPEILGYSTEYMEASSPRRKQIEDRLALLGLSGPKASEIAALDTREKKVTLTHDEVQQAHQAMAALHGHQPERVVASRHDQAVEPAQTVTPEAAVQYAGARNSERDAVSDARAILRDALVRSMGDQPEESIHAEFAKRTQDGTFLAVENRPGAASQSYTTPEMLRLERANIALMVAGQTSGRPLAAAHIRRDVEEHYPGLSDHQRQAVSHILTSPQRVQALDGIAGTGKTTVLGVIREAADREGYFVRGYAPTSRAAALLKDAGIPSMTLQRYLAGGTGEGDDAKRRLHVLDESSLASTPQMHAFLKEMPKRDRILLVGDARQHEAVDAGVPYAQLLAAGIQTTRLEEIVRQKPPELRAAVEDLAHGRTVQGLAKLHEQGRIHEVPNRRKRYEAMTAKFLEHPTTTLVVSPDNQSRTELNQMIRRGLQQTGQVGLTEHLTHVLVPRNDLTDVDRQWASRYEVGDIVRYTRGSKQLGLKAGEYARVVGINQPENLLRVRPEQGRLHLFPALSYDPKRLSGVTTYREVERPMAVGDSVHFTAPDKALNVANGTRGTVTAVDAKGIHLTLEREKTQREGRRLVVPAAPRYHLDHAWAVTTYKSQGSTADHVLVHADTADPIAKNLWHQRTTYVAGSRPEMSLDIYTDSKERLPHVLSRKVDHSSALGPRLEREPTHGFGR